MKKKVLASALAVLFVGAAVAAPEITDTAQVLSLYQSREGVTLMTQQPGSTVRVGVSVF